MAQGVAVPVVRLAMLGEALVLPVALGLGVMLVLTLGEALVEGVRVGTRLTVHPAPAPARPGLPEPAAVTLGEGEMAVEGEVLPLAGALALALMQRVVRALIVVRPEGIMERGAVALPEKLALVLGERVALGLALSLTLPVLLLEPDSLEQGEMVREAEAHFEALGLGETESVGRARVGVRVAFAEAVGPPLPALPRPAGVPQEVGVALLVREPAPPPLAEGEGEADTLTLGDRLSLALALEVTEALGLLAWARENVPPPPQTHWRSCWQTLCWWRCGWCCGGGWQWHWLLCAWREAQRGRRWRTRWRRQSLKNWGKGGGRQRRWGCQRGGEWRWRSQWACRPWRSAWGWLRGLLCCCQTGCE